MSQRPSFLKSSVIRHCNDLVVDLRVQNRGDKTCSYSLKLVRARFLSREHSGTFRLHCHHVDRRILLFEIFCRACQSSAGAYSGHKDVKFPVRVFPDLRSGSIVMGLRISGVVELSEDHRSRNGISEFLCLADRALHSQRALREDDLGSVCFEKSPSLRAHRIGQCEDRLISLGRCYAGKADPGISTGRFNDRCTGLNKPFLLSVLDHAKRHSVLGASCGI